MQDRHGRLPALLLILTVVTGLVDAVSYLKLGHAFVANMTGNVVFLGFALAGAAGLSAPASLVALAAFKGADIIRVHDVKFMARVAKMAAEVAKS